MVNVEWCHECNRPECHLPMEKCEHGRRALSKATVGPRQPIDLLADVIAQGQQHNVPARQVAKEAIEVLLAHGYTLEDKRDELRAAGIEIP